jgi:hypothetical protein
MRGMNARTLTVAVLLAVACGGGGVSSDEQARRAYLGLDPSIGKSMALGFQGFNSASSANIDPQSAAGDKSGTLTVTGQVDQGASNNKGMRLNVSMVGYSDGDVHLDGGTTVSITYSTDAGTLPALGLQLKGFPTGTFTGSLSGDYSMSGDLNGSVNLNLMMSGDLQRGADGGTERKPGTTTVTGTATSNGGTFQVNVSL